MSETNLPVAPVPQAKINAAVARGVGVLFTSVAEVWAVADNLKKGGAGPSKATTASIAAAILRGQALGLDLVTSMGQITVVNGRASLMGDLALGLVRQSGKLASFKREWISGEPTFDAKGKMTNDGYGCKITAKRADTGEEIDYTFTFGEARRAGILRTDIWNGFAKRMVYYRTLGFILRDLFSDVLMGLYVTEELQTIEQIEKGSTTVLPEMPPVEEEAAVVDPLFSGEPAKDSTGEPAKALPEGAAPALDLTLKLDSVAEAEAVFEAVATPLATAATEPPKTVTVTVEGEDGQPTGPSFVAGNAVDVLGAAIAEGRTIGPVPDSPEDPFRGFREPEPKATVPQAAEQAPPRNSARRVRRAAPAQQPLAPSSTVTVIKSDPEATGGRKW